MLAIMAPTRLLLPRMATKLAMKTVREMTRMAIKRERVQKRSTKKRAENQVQSFTRPGFGFLSLVIVEFGPDIWFYSLDTVEKSKKSSRRSRSRSSSSDSDSSHG